MFDLGRLPAVGARKNHYPFRYTCPSHGAGSSRVST